MNIIKYCIIVFALLFCNYSYARVEILKVITKKESTTQLDELPVPRFRYPILYTLNAQEGQIRKLWNGNYQLVLWKVSRTTNYNINNNKQGSISIAQFVYNWNHYFIQKDKNYVLGDITGVQVNLNTVGHKQFYKSIKLRDPVFDKKNRTVTFTIKVIDKNVKFSLLEKFNNATLFINGCTLCDCIKFRMQLEQCLLK